MQREQLIEQLGQENIPEEARKAILAARATTLSLLQDLVTDESLAGPEDPGEGWVPVQAVRLLCAMGDTTAIETSASSCSQWCPTIRSWVTASWRSCPASAP